MNLRKRLKNEWQKSESEGNSFLVLSIDEIRAIYDIAKENSKAHYNGSIKGQATVVIRADTDEEGHISIEAVS
jgi:hypothetical protein